MCFLCHLDEIRYIAANMQAIVTLAQNAPEVVRVVRGVVGALGSTISVPLPTGLTTSNLLASTILLTGSSGTVYSSESAVFTAKLVSGVLQLGVFISAPADVAGAVFCWRLVASRTSDGSW